MKKKYLAILLSLTLSIGIPFSSVYAEDGISVALNGETIEFDVHPQLVENRTMVPLRKIFEAMGATVEWDNDTQTVTATKGNERVIATVNNKNVYINGETKVLDVPPMIVDERTLVPTRFVAEAFGANVEWNEESKTVIINSPWDRIGDVPVYSYHSDVPDFGAIIGVSTTLLGKPYIKDNDVDSGLYIYNLNNFEPDDLFEYLDIIEEFGYKISQGDTMYICTKNGVYVDIFIDTKDDELTISITK